MLRLLRQNKGLTQVELGKQVGVSHVYISSLERGAKPAPRHAIVVALAAALETDESNLWAAAQLEREARLRLRVAGAPTSLRVPVTDSDTQEAEASVSSEDELLQQLRVLTSDKESKARTIQILKTLLDLLKE